MATTTTTTVEAGCSWLLLLLLLLMWQAAHDTEVALHSRISQLEIDLRGSNRRTQESAVVVWMIVVV